MDLGLRSIDDAVQKEDMTLTVAKDWIAEIGTNEIKLFSTD
jgi:hypothetical protein